MRNYVKKNQNIEQVSDFENYYYYYYYYYYYLVFIFMS